MAEHTIFTYRLPQPMASETKLDLPKGSKVLEMHTVESMFDSFLCLIVLVPLGELSETETITLHRYSSGESFDPENLRFLGIVKYDGGTLWMRENQ